MSNLNKRLAALESANADQRPIVIYEGEPGSTAPTDRLIIIIRRFSIETEQKEIES